MNSLIELQNVTKVYRLGTGQVHALRGVSLQIDEGEFIGIVGPSGSGKTSLLHVMGCVDRPTSGAVALGNKAIMGLSDKELTAVRRNAVGFVFQQFYLIPTMTALENVLLPTLFSSRKGMDRRAKELLETVALKDRMGHRISELSGGEMQRVAIARALINDPKILLADEPTGSLDSVNSKAIFGLFEQLNRQGLTIVVVTHNTELADMAKRIVRMKDGNIVG